MRLLLVLALVALLHGRSLERRELNTQVVKEKLESLLEKAREKFEAIKENVSDNLDAEIGGLNEAYDFAAAVVAEGKEKAGEAYDKALEIKGELGKVLEKAKDKVSDKLENQTWLNDAKEAVGKALGKVKGWFGKRAVPEDLIWDGMGIDDPRHRITKPVPYIGEHALDRQARGLIRDGVIIEKVPFSLRDDVIIEKIPYNAEVLEGVLVELKNRYDDLREKIHIELDNKLEDVRQAYQLASAVVAQKVENVKSSPEYQKAVADAQKIKDELEQVLKDKYGDAREKIDEFLQGKSEELAKTAQKVREGIAKGVDKAKEVVAGIKGWVWDAVDELLEPYTDKKKRELKSYQQMSAEEREQWDAIIDELKKVLKEKYGVQKRELKSFQQMSPEEREQWNSVLAELRQVLKDKFGIQDPDEDFRLSPESREKLANLRKEFLQKHGQTGHDDLTDDEFKKNWGNVVNELKAKFQQKRELKSYQQMSAEEREQWDAIIDELKKVLKEKYGVQKRELKSFQQMSPEEREQWNSVLAELRQVLKDKFGIQDPDEDFRLSPESREKLSDLRKELLQKHGQTGHDDLTDDEFKKNWGNVVNELKAKFQQKRELKSFQQMSPEEREQWNSVLAELRQVLKNKFGIQDPDEDFRLSPESREKLADLRKEFLQKHGQTGHDDLTDDVTKTKYQAVLDELKNMFGPRRVD